MKTVAFILSAMLICAGILPGEERTSGESNPSDIWYRGFLQTQAAEESIKAGDQSKGIAALDVAFVHFKRLALDFPEFHSEIVRHRLRLVAEKRHRLAKELQTPEPAEIETLEQELEAMKQRLERLRDRRRELDGELERIKKQDSRPAVGFNFDGLGPLEQGFERPGFHQATDLDEEKPFSRPKGLHALPLEGLTLDQFQAPQAKAEGEPFIPKRIPDDWLPRLYDGEMTYLIPLVETTETAPFTQIIPVPAVLSRVNSSK